MPPSKRTTLTKICKARRIIIERSRGRTDYDQLRASLSFAEQFQVNYPVASDQRVQEWCQKHAQHVYRLTTPNTRHLFYELMTP